MFPSDEQKKRKRDWLGRPLREDGTPDPMAELEGYDTAGDWDSPGDGDGGGWADGGDGGGGE